MIDGAPAEAEVAAGDVQLLLFEVGPDVLGADATQVLRIGRAHEGAVTLREVGPLRHGRRALVFRREGGLGEGEVRVDAIRGVVTVPVGELRRLPAAVQARPYAIGFWLEQHRPILLIDLRETQPVS